MHYVDAPGATPEGLFTEGDVQSGTQPTQVGADMMNALMLEIIHVCESRGIVLDKTNNYQLLQAIGEGAQGHRNYIINGGFEICQRGNQHQNVDDTSVYTLDRWRVAGDETGGAGEIDVFREPVLSTGLQRIGTLPYTQQQNSLYSMRLVGNSGLESTIGGPIVEQRIDALEELSHEMVIFSIYLKANTALTGNLIIEQNFGAGGGASAPVVVATQAVAIPGDDTFLQYSVSGLCPPTTGKTIAGTPYLSVRYENSVGEIGAGDEMELALAQLEKGITATRFDYRPFQFEMMLCQRFFEMSYDFDGGDAIGDSNHPDGQASAYCPSGVPCIGLGQRFRVPKRGNPNVTWYDPVAGTADRVNRLGSALTVIGDVGLSQNATGDPETSPSGGLGTVLGHWTAESEI